MAGKENRKVSLALCKYRGRMPATGTGRKSSAWHSPAPQTHPVGLAPGFPGTNPASLCVGTGFSRELLGDQGPLGPPQSCLNTPESAWCLHVHPLCLTHTCTHGQTDLQTQPAERTQSDTWSCTYKTKMGQECGVRCHLLGEGTQVWEDVHPRRRPSGL